jgi:formylglycine-generating enzyme required for sulfatase activity
MIVEPRRPTEPEMVRIPAGLFWMGSDRKALSDVNLGHWPWLQREMPFHRGYLPEFAIGQYPVTNSEYAAFVEDHGYERPEFWTQAGWRRVRMVYGWRLPRYWHHARWNQSNYPVVGVSWYECVAYCRWLSAVTGRLYRLPTEAEWEKAARGVDGRLWPWGNRWSVEKCNSWENELQRTTPVGHYSPGGDSPFGVADMVGNVWEWCVTRWGKPYPYDVDQNEWSVEYLNGRHVRVMRGGSWGCIRNLARCAAREYHRPNLRFQDRGFRIVKVL